MANPLISGGTLNRAKASVTVNSFPGLNVTISYLHKQGITLTPDSDFTDGIETAASMVQSPKIWVPSTVRIVLLKTQPLSAAWLAQIAVNTVIGNIVIRPDVATGVHPAYDLLNCSVQRAAPAAFDGQDPGFALDLRGTWYINSALFN